MIKQLFLSTQRLTPELMKYTIVGGMAFGIDFFILYMLTRYLNVHYLISAAIGFSIGLIFNYVLSILWVFSKRSVLNKTKEFLIFALIGVAGLCLNEIFLFIFTESFGYHYMVSKLFTTALVYIWNFTVRRYFLFS